VASIVRAADGRDLATTRAARQTAGMATDPVHPLVEQLRWMRSEFQRGLAGVTEDEATRRFEPMNSIGWIAAHMAWQEQRQWLTRAQGVTPHPELDELAPNGGPATTPSLALVQDLWAAVAQESNPWRRQVDTR
jgi:DinB family protein